jgi:S-adenosylmethionine-dependent methyltransferase
MSRLDSFIRRMQAQRACLDNATGLIHGLPGNVLEFGLGNGRTYDHLRERLPNRDIFVFDRQLAAHPDCIPPADRLFFGEVLETLPQAIARLGANTALANLDIGSGDEQATQELVHNITPLLLRLLKPGAVIVSGRPLEHSSLTALSLPYAVKPGRHFMYSRTSHENFTELVDLKHVNDNEHRRILAGE